MLPIEVSLDSTVTVSRSLDGDDSDEIDMQSYIDGIVCMRDKMFEETKTKISAAQCRYKKDYDRKHRMKKVS